MLNPWSEKISSVFLQWVQVQIRILFSEVVYHISKDFRSYCSSHSFSWKAGLIFLRNREILQEKDEIFLNLGNFLQYHKEIAIYGSELKEPGSVQPK